jgi:hypothetical protein
VRRIGEESMGDEHFLTWAALHVTAEWVIRLVMLVYVPQKRSPAAARSWLLLIFMLPYVGLILYAIFGRPYLPRHRLEAQERASNLLRTKGQEIFGRYAARPETPGLFTQSVTLAESLGDFGVVGGNDVELITDYVGAIDRLVADIDSAVHHVHLVYYIFADDGTGRLVADALARAVARGVPRADGRAGFEARPENTGSPDARTGDRSARIAAGAVVAQEIGSFRFAKPPQNRRRGRKIGLHWITKHRQSRLQEGHHL